MSEFTEDLFETIDGEEVFDEGELVAWLLHENVLVVLPGERPQTKLCVMFNCSDLFAWGSADCEDVPYSEIAALAKARIVDPQWGASKWCCRQRNQRPQGPVERRMREAGAWDDAMEALPKNTDDAEVHALFAAAAAQSRQDREGTSS